MTNQIKTDKQDFETIEKLISPYDTKGRDKSASLLLWFLETVFRLDDVESVDAICDRQSDKGLDAIVANDIRRQIIVFQAKRREKLPATLGDVDLKTFVGSLNQLSSKSSVLALEKSTRNPDLKRLLNKLDIAGKIAAGYSLRAIFVTNVAANEDAIAFMSHVKGRGRYELDVWDSFRLSPVLKQLQKDWFVSIETKLNVIPSELFIVGSSKTNPDLVYAAIKAKDLVLLPGIDDSRVFAQNVRLGLGSTRVNDDIIASIEAKSEHKHFLTFHNGLTIVSKSIKLRGSKLIVNDFSVCNGCQSLLSFYQQKKRLSDQLKVLVRFVKIGDDRRLPETIAYRTNNQNSISLRDLSSNDVTQVRFQKEFNEQYGNYANYTIKRGESSTAPELPNEFAGRLLLALYLREPWSAHQKYKIFGDLETKIFSYYTSAPQIRLAQLLYEKIQPKLSDLKNKKIARYGLTSFLMLYFVGEILRENATGTKLLDDPRDYLSTNSTVNANEAVLLAEIGKLVDWLIIELNYTIDQNGDDTYDYKNEFKSPKSVQQIKTDLLKSYQKDIARSKVSAIKLPKKNKKP